MQCLKNNPDDLESAILEAFELVLTFQRLKDENYFSQLNIVISDGHQTYATRFASKGAEALSLYYGMGLEIEKNNEDSLLVCGKEHGAIVVASEPLTGYVREWEAVPENYLLHISPELDVVLKPIEL